jgi:hypothetical protein
MEQCSDHPGLCSDGDHKHSDSNQTAHFRVLQLAVISIAQMGEGLKSTLSRVT